MPRHTIFPRGTLTPASTLLRLPCLPSHSPQTSPQLHLHLLASVPLGAIRTDKESVQSWSSPPSSIHHRDNLWVLSFTLPTCVCEQTLVLYLSVVVLFG